MEIRQPTLWLFDCRCSGSSGPRFVWVTVDYAKVLMQMRSWMQDVPQYNAVFMLPQAHTYHEVGAISCSTKERDAQVRSLGF